MRVNKRALRLLPVTLLLEMLSPVITLLFILLSGLVSNLAGRQAGMILLITAGLMLIMVWLTGSVFVYGIMDLSRYFRYSWYLHIVYFIIKSVTLVLDGISVAMGDEINPSAVIVYDSVSDILSSARQLAGMAALCLVLMGMRQLLYRHGEEKLSDKCRKYSYIVMITGIMLSLNDLVNIILAMFFPGMNDGLNWMNLPMIVIYVILNVITFIISLPVFLTVRGSCMAVYDMLRKAREV